MESPQLYRLAENIRIRREHFGGIVFNTKTGALLEVDREAFVLLTKLSGPDFMALDFLTGSDVRRSTPGRHKDTILKTLLNLRVIETTVIPPNRAETISAVTDTALRESVKMMSWPVGPNLSAPETVHWAITYQCANHCVDCYAARNHHQYATAMNTQDALRTVDLLANWGVLQLAVGGGEPLLRADLPVIIKHASENGLIVHLTIGQDRVETSVLTKLATGLTCLQLGINAQQLMTCPDTVVSRLSLLVQQAKDLGLQTGANLIMQRTTLGQLSYLIELLAVTGVERIVLLRYKPPASVLRWKKEKPTPEVLLDLERLLPQFQFIYPHIQFRVDCGLSFMQRHQPTVAAATAGIYGCTAAQRILALTPDGSVFPCSQLVQPPFQAGNILHDDPAALWSQAKIFKTYRSFRDKTVFKQSQCGICSAQKHCGGCRVFAADALGADPGCPDPLTPEMRFLGKAGRRLDMEKYCRLYGRISVAGYMERYGVGQKSAVRELQAVQNLTKSDPKSTGRKKTDWYEWRDYDLIGDIQASIGCTAGGFPYVTREEIGEWLEAEDVADYPDWLQKQKGEMINEDY
jgi:radical SAM protein with 4Fe4S-binding SPASM domain